MSTEEVCMVLWDENLTPNIKPWCVHALSPSCADSIVNTAFQRGSMDNLAAVVVPLGSGGASAAFFQDQIDVTEFSSFEPQNVINQNAGYQGNNKVGTSILPSDYYKKMISKFNRLMVEARNNKLGCFYLSENLNDHMDYIFHSPKNVGEDSFRGLENSLLEPLEPYPSGQPLDLYNDHNFCWHFGIHEGDKGQCTSPEVITNLLGLLDSISYNDSNDNNTNSFGHMIPDLRYKLNKRFDRGSYGEVWLAFRWNCSEEHGSSNSSHGGQTFFFGSPRPTHLYDANPSGSPSNESHDSNFSCNGNFIDVDSFILKRIMVERGNGAYLSGLREKYFGEIFLNASLSLRNMPTTGFSPSFSMEDEIHSDNQIETDTSDVDKAKRRYDMRNTDIGNLKMRKINCEIGLSLSKLIYTAEAANSLKIDEVDENVKNIQVLHPSKWWYWLRTTEAGKKEMQSIIWQLLLALKSCHDRNVTHRDIKPENMIICFEEVNTGRCLREVPSIGSNQYHTRMRLIDFGSAIDEFTLKHLYGSGPTRSEQTFEYTPPEALLNSSWFHAPCRIRLKYDMWSVGVVMLELILGSPHVFQITDRNRALVDQHLEGWSEPIKDLIYKNEHIIK
ncbi:putative inactive protein kinase [Platanthera guangdongensis]|uniref:Inactive protein kinase n=1 Tax=Platanthera guangdongensis TaxID=2320717 RepID=A0ABR2MEH4_9ASPA